MSTIYEVPLTPEPQSFTITLVGVQYGLRLTYANVPEGGWLLDISDTLGNPIVCGIPLVTGADLLGQYAYLGISGSLYASTDGDPDAKPVFANLGTTSHLYFVTPD